LIFIHYAKEIKGQHGARMPGAGPFDWSRAPTSEFFLSKGRKEEGELLLNLVESFFPVPVILVSGFLP